MTLAASAVTARTAALKFDPGGRARVLTADNANRDGRLMHQAIACVMEEFVGENA